MATRKHKKIVAQLEKDLRSCGYALEAWRRHGGEEQKEHMLKLIDAPVPGAFPYRTKMSKDDCVLHPPPNLHDYDKGARGPGSAPASWFTRWYGIDYDDSSLHQAAYDRARIRWRHSNACLAQSLAS